jgi:murein DD-endopeptidase MepM/ murein hydrolase activator NlpD
MQRPWRRPYQSASPLFCSNEAGHQYVSAIRNLIGSISRAQYKLSAMKRPLIFAVGVLIAAAFTFFLIAELGPAREPGHSAANAPSTAIASVRSAHDSADPAPARVAATPTASKQVAAAATSVAASQPGPLLIPVAGVKASQLSDTFAQARGAGRVHDAIDILAPRGTPVLAVDDGKVVKLFNSKPGGLTVYQFDPSEKFAYYYAHLDRYAPGLAEGQQLKRGELVGYVGSSGNANPAAPHLHFTIFVLGPGKHWWQGTAIDPYPLLTTR